MRQATQSGPAPGRANGIRHRMNFADEQLMPLLGVAPSAKSNRRGLFPVAGKEVPAQLLLMIAAETEGDVDHHCSISRPSQSCMNMKCRSRLSSPGTQAVLPFLCRDQRCHDLLSSCWTASAQAIRLPSCLRTAGLK